MTLTELKRRHETGEKQVKTVRAKIQQQLRRRCGFKECSESLSFTRSGMYCSKSCANKQKYLVRKQNKLKKKTYYEKHGIKFDKTIRNRNFQGGITPGDTLLYEDYKEPLRKIEKAKGYGFYGTVALSPDRELVQCHICGNLFPNVGAHLHRHRVSATKYKEMYGLNSTTALIGDGIREAMQKKAVKMFDGTLPAHLVEYNKKVQNGEIKHKAHGKNTMTLEVRNKLGLCPEQVLERIQALKDTLGHVPSLDEFQEAYKGRYLSSIKYLHGSWAKAVKKACGTTAEELRRPNRERLIEELVDFNQRHGRIPMTSDFNRGLLRDRGVYIRSFGSLNNARIEAGLNAVIPMPFGQIVELTPEEYIEYKNGHAVSKFKEPHQRERKRKSKAKKLMEIFK